MKRNFMENLLDGVEVEWKALEEVFNILAGGDVPKDALSDIKTEEFCIPILSNGIGDKSLYGWTNKAKIVNPSLTISARGTIGWTSFRDEPFFPIVRLLVLTPKIEFNLKYAYHFMKMIENDYKTPKTGIPQLTKPMIKDIKIPIPCPDNPEKSLEIQAEIVRILDTFTELTAELTAELEARKKQYAYYREQLLTFEEGEVEWKALGETLVRTKGTKITAGQMKELHKINAPLKIFAGGKTIAFVDFEDIPKKDINREPSIIVKSRGNIEFEYYDKPFSHKNEMWSYHSKNKNINIKFVYYFLKINELYFQNIGSRMQMPQIATPDTDKFKIPVPPIEEQDRIVSILDKFDALTSSITEGLPREIELRQKQYEYYRNMLLSFPKEEVEK